MTKKAAFYQDDITRAVRGAVAGGLTVGTVRIAPDGSIEIYSVEAVDKPRVNTMDRVLG